MKKVKIALIALSLLASGCVTTRYVHPTKDVRDYAHDSYQCETVAMERQHYRHPRDRSYFVAKDEWSRCMQLIYGWQKIYVER